MIQVYAKIPGNLSVNSRRRLSTCCLASAVRNDRAYALLTQLKYGFGLLRLDFLTGPLHHCGVKELLRLGLDEPFWFDDLPIWPLQCLRECAMVLVH